MHHWIIQPTVRLPVAKKPMDNRRLPYLPQSNAGSINPSTLLDILDSLSLAQPCQTKTRLIHQCKSLTMKNITLIALKRITYIISVHTGFVINYSPNTRFDNAQCFIVKTTTDWRFSATMALPDWQSGEYATNYTDFLATTQQRFASDKLKYGHPSTVGNRFYLRR